MQSAAAGIYIVVLQAQQHSWLMQNLVEGFPFRINLLDVEYTGSISVLLVLLQGRNPRPNFAIIAEVTLPAGLSSALLSTHSSTPAIYQKRNFQVAGHYLGGGGG